jgi:tRNA threonylcarbamoyladenosine biosynthesis protein TsaE
MRIESDAELRRAAGEYVSRLMPGKMARVLALSGDLGAGKTTFVSGIAASLGVTEPITSPTFVIMKIYDLEHAKFERLIHIDAYRLKGMQHLKVLGWNELTKDPTNLICIEWPEMIAEAIPKDAIRIELRYSEGEGRTIIWHNHA